MPFQIEITHSALEMLVGIADTRIRGLVAEKIDQLAIEPDLIGKPLSHELAGYWSARAAGQRYRIVYTLDKGNAKVTIIAIGIRKEGGKKDIYQLAKKLLRSGLLGA